MELYDKTLAVRPNDVTLLERKSEVWHRLGDLDYRTQAPVANAAYQKAVAIRERLVAEHPAEPRFRMALSRSYNGVAITSSGNAQLDPYRRSLELRLKLAGEIPDDPDLLHGLNESFINLASLLWNRGHQSEALDLTNRSIEYGHAGFARRPHDLEFAMDLATSYSETVNFSWRLGRRDESLAISADGVAYPAQACVRQSRRSPLPRLAGEYSRRPRVVRQRRGPHRRSRRRSLVRRPSCSRQSRTRKRTNLQMPPTLEVALQCSWRASPPRET